MQKASKSLRQAAAHKFKLNMKEETLDRTL
jgi:hypothetical protein